MTAHLLQIAIGPVQEFISAARRTRDLWFGSYLLSEVSRAAAKAVEQAIELQGGQLIFPASADPSVTENVANVILAELNSGDPIKVTADARKAAQECWEEFVAAARALASEVICEGAWKDQIPDVVEFYTAWVSRSEQYRDDRLRVMRLLNGRKSCREFRQPGFNDTGLEKSSLDGQRPTVVGPKPGESRRTYRDDWPKAVRQALRLSPGEQLDVVGVTKRLGKRREGGAPSYPSVARVAAETWLCGVREQEAAFKELHAACAEVTTLNQVAGPKYAYFPFEGTVIFKDRHADLIAELGEEVREPLRRVAQVLKKLDGEPNPYLAVLVADGDSMGARLSEFKRPDEHRDFSRILAGFAAAAREAVDKHCGTLIYAGGDDVLAFLPLHTCLSAARDLRTTFHQTTGMTLSVGVAIGHFMENLEDLLAYGRAAEKDAKQPNRDGLAVHMHKRGGSPVKVREQWSADPGSLGQRLQQYARWFSAKSVSNRTPYELRGLADLYDDWPPATREEAIQRDAIRVIEKKRPGGERTKEMQEIGTAVKARVKNAADLRGLASELMIARQLAVALRQSGGGKNR
jgi:CRISPR-associated protein Cmr2